MRRGLTMIETLLALALLTTIVSAGASWIGLAARLSVAADPARRQALVEIVLQRLHEDLLTGDFAGRRPTENSGEPHRELLRVRAGHAGLEIDLRRGATCTYRLERNGGGGDGSTLVRMQRDSDGASETRSLISRVADFHCAIDAKGRTLEVTIESTSAEGGAATSMTRRYAL